MQSFFDVLSSQMTVSEDLKQFFTQNIQSKKFKKGEYVFKHNFVCDKIYFLTKGSLYTYYFNSKGKKTIANFYLDNSFCSSITSFKHDAPSKLGAVVLEDTSTLFMEKNIVQLAFQKFPELLLIYSNNLDLLFTELEAKYFALQSESAKTRYDMLSANRPELFQRVNLGLIASHLGMNQATLSRLRGSR